MENNLQIIQKNEVNIEKIFSKLTSVGIQVNNVKTYFNDYTPIKAQKDQCNVVLDIHSKVIDCIDIYFGIRANQLSDALIDNIVKTIYQNYNDLSVEEILIAYDTHTPQKTDWRNVTKPEILKPINDYLRTKKRILIEYQNQIKEQTLEGERLIEAQNFYNKSCDIYNQSLIEKKWLGDCFNASVIYKKFRDNFTQEQKNDLKQKASELFYKYQKENEIMFYAYSEERILADLVIETAIKNQWHLKI